MSEQGASDEELVRRIGGGDPSALEVLYDRYAPTLLGLAFRVLSDRAAAEEVVQDTFWRVWRYASSYRAERGSVAAWIGSITRNLSIDELRRRQVRPLTVEVSEETTPLGVTGPFTPAEELSFKEHRERVRRALGELPESQRRVLELAYFQGLTHVEIAESTGEPLGTIHTRARLGLQKLRQLLGM